MTSIGGKKGRGKKPVSKSCDGNGFVGGVSEIKKIGGKNKKYRVLLELNLYKIKFWREICCNKKFK